MSANNWAICPKCQENEAKQRAAIDADLEQAYGQVSPAEYRAMWEKAKERPKQESTLREDYEIGIFEGKFYVDYRGGCSKCGFTYEYKFYDNNPTATG